jgi:CRISPR/Cas system endoribonuclease Cas6 (RAMP superfamily)
LPRVKFATKCLNLEDKYNLILDECADLEKLQEMDDELQANARELELKLRKDLDFAQSKFRHKMQLNLEDKYNLILEECADLEKLQEMDDELQENAHKLELKLAGTCQDCNGYYNVMSPLVTSAVVIYLVMKCSLS